MALTTMLSMHTSSPHPAVHVHRDPGQRLAVTIASEEPLAEEDRS